MEETINTIINYVIEYSGVIMTIFAMIKTFIATGGIKGIVNNLKTYVMAQVEEMKNTSLSNSSEISELKQENADLRSEMKELRAEIKKLNTTLSRIKEE